MTLPFRSMFFIASTPRDPFNWRWQRACSVLAQEHVGSGGGDAYVDAAIAFLRAEQAQPQGVRPAIANRVARAIQIHNTEDMRKWALQAWLLTGESLARVARETSVPLPVVKWYRRLFFDVGKRMTAPGFITHQVIGSKLHCGLTPQDVGVPWKLFGYWYGPHLLSLAIEDLLATGKPDYSHLLADWRDDQNVPELRRWLHRVIRVRLLSAAEALRYSPMVATSPDFAETPERLVHRCGPVGPRIDQRYRGGFSGRSVHHAG